MFHPSGCSDQLNELLSGILISSERVNHTPSPDPPNGLTISCLDLICPPGRLWIHQSYSMIFLSFFASKQLDACFENFLSFQNGVRVE